MPDFTAFYERLRDTATLPTTSQPSIGDFLAVLRAAARRRPRRRVDPHRRRDLRHGRVGAPGGDRGAGAPSGPARRGRRLAQRRRRTGHDRARRRRGRARRRRRSTRSPRTCGRPRTSPEDLVRGRHAGVPAPRRAHRHRPGVARRRAEDQADPHRRRRDHADRARAHRRPRVRAHGRLPATTLREEGATPGRAAHPRPRPGRPPGRARHGRSSAATRSRVGGRAGASARTSARACSASAGSRRASWRPSRCRDRAAAAPGGAWRTPSTSGDGRTRRQSRYSRIAICTDAAIGIATSAPTTPTSELPKRTATRTTIGATLTVRRCTCGWIRLFSICW